MAGPVIVVSVPPEKICWRGTPTYAGNSVYTADGEPLAPAWSMISLPLIGDVQANRLRANQLADRIKERLKDYMESPTVSVSVIQVNSYIIYVLGEVTTPGKYQLKSYATVLQAIAVAGGFTQFASKNNLRVIRNGVNGHGEQG